MIVSDKEWGVMVERVGDVRQKKLMGREGGMGRSEGWEMNEWDEVQGGVRGERLEVIDEGWLTKDVRWGRGRLITGKQSEIRGGG